MKITKENLPSYLLTLQLVEAGYHLTYDELIEMNEVRYYLNPETKYIDEFTITVEQNKSWFVKAIPIIKKLFYCNEFYARSVLGWHDLYVGLKVKNK
jgi:hypothetical protein